MPTKSRSMRCRSSPMPRWHRRHHSVDTEVSGPMARSEPRRRAPAPGLSRGACSSPSACWRWPPSSARRPPRARSAAPPRHDCRRPFPSRRTAGHRPPEPDRRRTSPRKSGGCVAVPPGRAATRTIKDTVRLGCFDCHGGNPTATDKEQAHVAAALPRRLADLGQPGPLLHAAQPRVAGVHPLRQSRRPARRPHQLRHRRLPPARSAAESARA